MTSNSLMLGPTATPIPTPTNLPIIQQKTPDDLFPILLQNDCRCVDGRWQGGLCDSWQRSKTCGLGDNCLKDNSRCGSLSDNNCCSGYCTETPYGYYCNSKANILEAYSKNDKLYRCEGNMLMRFANGGYVKEKMCDGGCIEQGQSIQCLDAPVPTQSPYDLQLQTFQKEIGSTCSQKDSCCAGGNGVCVGTGILNSGGLKCLACDASAVCWNNSCQNMTTLKPGCDPATSGIMRDNNTTGGKCFICVKADNIPAGFWFAANSSICDKYDKGERQPLNGNEILNSVLSPEDQYKIRNLGYLNTVISTKDSWEQAQVMGLMFGDNMTQGWATANKFLQQGIATIGDTFGQQLGNRTPTSKSSMGSYFQQTLNTKIELEKQGKPYAVDFLTQALPVC